MSRLSKLVGKLLEVKIGGEMFTFHPLTLKDLPLLMSLGNTSDNKKQSEAMREVIEKSLKEAVPDATEEELRQVAVSYFYELSEAIMKVNGLNNADREKDSGITAKDLR